MSDINNVFIVTSSLGVPVRAFTRRHVAEAFAEKYHDGAVHVLELERGSVDSYVEELNALDNEDYSQEPLFNFPEDFIVGKAGRGKTFFHFNDEYEEGRFDPFKFAAASQEKQDENSQKEEPDFVQWFDGFMKKVNEQREEREEKRKAAQKEFENDLEVLKKLGGKFFKTLAEDTKQFVNDVQEETKKNRQ